MHGTGSRRAGPSLSWGRLTQVAGASQAGWDSDYLTEGNPGLWDLMTQERKLEGLPGGGFLLQVQHGLSADDSKGATSTVGAFQSTVGWTLSRLKLPSVEVFNSQDLRWVCIWRWVFKEPRGPRSRTRLRD